MSKGKISPMDLGSDADNTLEVTHMDMEGWRLKDESKGEEEDHWKESVCWEMFKVQEVPVQYNQKAQQSGGPLVPGIGSCCQWRKLPGFAETKRDDER